LGFAAPCSALRCTVLGAVAAACLLSFAASVFRVGWSALVVLAIVAALALLVRVVEPSFAFYPLAGETVTPGDLGLDFERLTITSSDGERLQAWRLPVDAA